MKHHGVSVVVAFLVPSLSAAQSAGGDPYVCPLPQPAVVAPADPLASGAWTTGGGFDDRRPVGIDAQRNRILAQHGGIDLSTSIGTPVLAIRAGRVVAAVDWSHLGRTIIVEHPGRVYSLYAFLGGSSVLEGATVGAGDKLGSVGFSGDADLVRRNQPTAVPRLHLSLIAGRREGLAGPGQPLRALNSSIDVWPAALDSIATPIDPTTRLPARCWQSGRGDSPMYEPEHLETFIIV